jgi:hypothetical protein
LGPLFRAATGNAAQQNQPKLSDTDTAMTSMRSDLEALKTTVNRQQAALDALHAPATPASSSGSPPAPPTPPASPAGSPPAAPPTKTD